MISIMIDVGWPARCVIQRATPFLSGVVLLWSFRSLDSSAAYQQLLQLILLRTIRTRAASSCRHRISRYQTKRPKTANFIGIKYNSQSIFTSLSHSALENNASEMLRQDLFQGEGKKNLAENSHSWLKGSRKSTGRARWLNPCHHKPQKRGDFIMGVWEFPRNSLHGPGA
jgi:hypothetical protein